MRAVRLLDICHTGGSSIPLWQVTQRSTVPSAGMLACFISIRNLASSSLATVVGGFLPQDAAILTLYRLPLGQVVLVYRRTYQIGDGHKARDQKEPTINS